MNPTFTYISSKIVQAKKMTRGTYNMYRGWDIPKDENPLDEGYLITYPDGHETWMPTQVFETTFTYTDGMSFGHAIEAMKQGHKVARQGWKNKDIYIYYVAPSAPLVSDLRGAAETHVGEGKDGLERVHINGHIDMKAADGSIVVGWLVSETDILSTDWSIV